MSNFIIQSTILYYLPIKQNFRKVWRNTMLLLFSIGFYAWGEPIFVYVMLASVFLNWWIVQRMDKAKHRKAWLSVAITLDVLLLGVFKYVSFISENIAALLKNDSMIVSIALPIGISFFVFQMMSYVFDVYYRKAKAQKNPFYVAMYIVLFPQLIAGPIVRYTEVESDILTRRESFDAFTKGIKRFIYGFGKKVLIANYVAQIADNVFDMTQNPSVMLSWLGAIAYALQIYFDFSGYSDMAIGLGDVFGFHFSENFRYPYMAHSVTDFWRRWHISLSTWFRDYVYIPMGGNRVKKARWIFNLFVVWALTGIWHGANWTFLAWGLLYFVILLIEKLTGWDKKNNVLSHIGALLVIIVAWVLFRSADMGSAITYLGNMIGIGGSGTWYQGLTAHLKGTYPVLIAGLIGVTPIVGKLFAKLREYKLGFIEDIWLLLVFAFAVFDIVGATYNPFIYFNF